MARMSHDDFMKLPLEELEGLTGVAREGDGEADYRARAWDSYKQDVANEEEWGGTEGESVAPEPEPER